MQPPISTLPSNKHKQQLQEETELLQSEDRPAELEEVSEKIHKRFHIKEVRGFCMACSSGSKGLLMMMVMMDKKVAN